MWERTWQMSVFVIISGLNGFATDLKVGHFLNEKLTLNMSVSWKKKIQQ